VELTRYVCEQCASSIDADLADYAYNPNHIPEKRSLENSEGNYFGDCPECGAAGACLNIHADHWLICHKHGVKWFVGSKLFSGWREEAEELWNRNAQFLAGFRHIHRLHILDPAHYARVKDEDASRLEQSLLTQDVIVERVTSSLECAFTELELDAIARSVFTRDHLMDHIMARLREKLEVRIANREQAPF
jgi:hypothetical protein